MLIKKDVSNYEYKVMCKAVIDILINVSINNESEFNIIDKVVFSRLIEFLKDKDKNKNLHQAVAIVLGQLGINSTGVVSTFLEASTNKDNENMRKCAAYAFQKLTVENKTMIKALLNLLEHNEAYVRERAVATLSHLGVSSKEVIAGLLGILLKDKNNRVRKAAQLSLRALNVQSRTVFNGLLKALNGNKEWPARIAAALGLSALNFKNKMVFEVLLAGLKDKESTVRIAAIKTLGELRSNNETVINGLLQSLQDHWPMCRYAAEALGNLGVNSEAVIRELLTVFNNEKEFLLNEVVRCCHEEGIDDESLIIKFFDGLDKNQLSEFKQLYASMLISTIEALGKLAVDSKAVVTSLSKVLRNKHEYARQKAVEVLGELGVNNKGVIKNLLNVLERDKSQKVRQEAATALAKLGSRSKEVISGLFEALEDEAYFVRESAASALVKLGVSDELIFECLIMEFNSDEYYIDGYSTEDGIDEDDIRDLALEALARLDPVGSWCLPAVLRRNDLELGCRLLCVLSDIYSFEFDRDKLIVHYGPQGLRVHMGDGWKTLALNSEDLPRFVKWIQPILNKKLSEAGFVIPDYSQQ